jgi:hypothetical protein
MMNAAKINSNIARQALSAQRQQNVSLVARATPISSLHTSATQVSLIVKASSAFVLIPSIAKEHY